MRHFVTYFHIIELRENEVVAEVEENIIEGILLCFQVVEEAEGIGAEGVLLSICRELRSGENEVI